jgi:hypothetical protein
MPPCRQHRRAELAPVRLAVGLKCHQREERDQPLAASNYEWVQSWRSQVIDLPATLPFPSIDGSYPPRGIWDGACLHRGAVHLAQTCADFQQQERNTKDRTHARVATHSAYLARSNGLHLMPEPYTPPRFKPLTPEKNLGRDALEYRQFAACRIDDDAKSQRPRSDVARAWRMRLEPLGRRPFPERPKQRPPHHRASRHARGRVCAAHRQTFPRSNHRFGTPGFSDARRPTPLPLFLLSFRPKLFGVAQ